MIATAASPDSPTFRTLPLRVAPLPGEAIDSWLEAVAHRHQVRFADILRLCGITRHARNAAWWRSLTGEEALRIAIITGTEPARVRAMTLNSVYNAEAQLHEGQRRTYASWARRAGSRFCPRCLRQNNGRWPLAWRIDLCFACPTHRCLLADSCPMCGACPRRLAHPAGTVPQPAICIGHQRREGRVGTQCGHDYTTVGVLRLPDGHPIASAQQKINDLLGGESVPLPLYGTCPPSTDRVLSDIALIARWVAVSVDSHEIEPLVPKDISTSLAEYRRRCGWQESKHRMAALSSVESATGIAIALEMMACENRSAATLLLAQLLTGAITKRPYRVPIGRQADLTTTIANIRDAAYAAEGPGRRLASRLARRSANAAHPTPTSHSWPR
jgi:hypothetical protein